MNNTKILLIALLFTMGITLNTAPVLAVETSGSASVDVMSQYIWRGQQLTDKVAIQPSVGITYGGFGANLWANYDTHLDEHTETDLTLNFANSIEKFSYEAGYIYYALEGVDDTQEIYLTVGYDVILSPSATLYWDFDEGEGAYLVVSIGHSFALQHNLSLDLGASMGVNFNNDIMGFDDDGDDFTDLYDGNISAALTIPVTDNISIAPMIAYSFPLSSDAEDALEAIADDITGDDDADVFYGGVNFSLSF
jgi:uncharacterized protein (TIGR02001 family)